MEWCPSNFRWLFSRLNPRIQKPTDQEPTVQEPTVQEPTVQELTDQEPTVQELTDQEECCICLETCPEDKYKTLNPCMHKLCTNCLDNLIIKNINKCPLCRERFDNKEPSTSDIGHAADVQRSIQMMERLPRRLLVEVVDVRTGNTRNVAVRDLVEEILASVDMRLNNISQYESVL